MPTPRSRLGFSGEEPTRSGRSKRSARLSRKAAVSTPGRAISHPNCIWPLPEKGRVRNRRAVVHPRYDWRGKGREGDQRMPFNHEEAELPRYIRKIRFVSHRRRNDPETPDESTGVLSPFAGVLKPRIDAEYRLFPDLTYLVLRPLRLTERRETVTEHVATVRETRSSVEPDLGASPFGDLVSTETGSRRSDRRMWLEGRTFERRTVPPVANASRRSDRSESFSQTTVGPRVFRHSRTKEEIGRSNDWDRPTVRRDDPSGGDRPRELPSSPRVDLSPIETRPRRDRWYGGGKIGRLRRKHP